MSYRYVYDKDEIRERLPLAYAAHRVGVLFGSDSRALCPFHDDRNTPNLELMPPGDDGTDWYYCRACGANGDCISLVRKVEGLTFADALRTCSRFLDDLPEDYERPVLERRSPWVITPEWTERVREHWWRAYENQHHGLLSFAYGFVDEHTPIDERRAWDRHLLDWGWGLNERYDVVIPHLSTDRRLTAVKVRTRERRWLCFGPLVSLYGDHRPKLHPEVVLCEGESDTVWADAQGCPVDVRGIPGAGTFREEWIRTLSSWDVVHLALDPDEAGRLAADRYADALFGRTRRVELPLGKDLRAAGIPLRELL